MPLFAETRRNDNHRLGVLFFGQHLHRFGRELGGHSNHR